MLTKSTARNNILLTVSTVLIIELVFGGSGRILEIGSLSLRYFLFGLALVIVLLWGVNNRLAYEKYSLVLLGLFFSYMLLNAVFSVNNGTLEECVGSQMGYLSLVIALFFEQALRENSNRANEVVEVIYKTILLYACLTIAIWLWCFTNPATANQILRTEFLEPFDYGLYDTIGGKIPRLFLKGAVFLGIGLLLSLHKSIRNFSVKNIVVLLIFLFAILTTFSFGLYFTTLICSLFLIYKEGVIKTPKIMILVIITIAGFAVVLKSGALGVMIERINSDYSSFGYRAYMVRELGQRFLENPMFGKGAHYKFIFLNMTMKEIRATYHIEIMWLELLVTSGIMGFALFISHIIMTTKRMLGKSEEAPYLLPLAVGVVFLCIESLSNPYMNNAIGLGFYGFCVGITNAMLSERHDKTHNSK